MSYDPGWPIHAKAVIQREYAVDHLNIWLTFAAPMDQTVMPPLDHWLTYVDTTLLSIISSDWQDAYTLLLVSNSFVGPPARVLVAYAGPSQSLRTTTHTQWQPWGPILAHDLIA